MLDRFIVGSVTRISPEAPVPIVRFLREHERLGGAANVAHNIAVLGGRATIVGTVGSDAAAGSVRARLEAAGIVAGGLVEDTSRPTTAKARIVTERNQQVARIDYEDDGDPSPAIERALADRIASMGDGAHAVLVSDYLKGVVTPAVMEALRAVGRGGARPPVIVDPKDSAPRVLCRGCARHAESSRSRNRHALTDQDRRRGKSRRNRLPPSRALCGRSDHAR